MVINHLLNGMILQVPTTYWLVVRFFLLSPLSQLSIENGTNLYDYDQHGPTWMSQEVSTVKGDRISGFFSPQYIYPMYKDRL